VLPGLLKGLISHKVVAVVVGPEFLQNGLEFVFVDGDVHGGHLVKVGGVEPRGEDGVLGGSLDPWADFLKFRLLKGIYHESVVARLIEGV